MLRAPVATLLLVVLVPVAARAQAVYLEPVSARLVADVRAVEAGRPFHAGVVFDVQRGWHVYWQNPGDSGLPTKVALRAPDGFAVGALGWPLPRRFTQPGDLVGYGYADRLLLAATVTPPATLAAGAPVALAADVGWLACAHICLRGTKTLALALAAGDAAPSDDAPAFTAWAAELPTPLAEAGDVVTATWHGAVPAGGADGTVTTTLDWKVPVADVEWFPPGDRALLVDAATSTTTGTRTELVFRARVAAGQTPEARILGGVVTWRAADGRRRGVIVPLPLDATATKEGSSS
jgi:DsbC/DsbD-like thiol-disulfide interchange protein